MQTSATGYVKGGRLHIVGLAQTDKGAVPFSYHQKVKGGLPEGPVALFGADVHPAVKEAMQKAHGPINSRIAAERMRLHVENTVDRSRLGDQNATAILCLVGQKARAGDGKAVYVQKLARAYIAKNPPPEFGAEPAIPVKPSAILPLQSQLALAATDPSRFAVTLAAYVPSLGLNASALNGAAVMLSNMTRPIDAAFLTLVRKALPTEHGKIFTDGTKAASLTKVRATLNKLAPKARGSHLVGYVLGTAQRVQNIRKPGTPIASISALAAWELGENVKLPTAAQQSAALMASTLPPIPPEIRGKNISQAGKSPPGFEPLKGLASSAVQARAKAIVFGPHDFGYEEYATIEGVDYFFRLEPHYHPPEYQGGPHGWHKGATTYVRKEGVYSKPQSVYSSSSAQGHTVGTPKLRKA